MQKFKQILATLILFSLTFSTFSIVKAEGEENQNTGEENVDYSIPTVANDPRVRLLGKNEIHKKRIEIKVDNWPHKHKLGTGSLISILHKPAWMYLNDNKINCEESGSTYFIVNDKGEKIRKISLNCSIAFSDKEKTKELSDEVFSDTKKSETSSGTKEENNKTNSGTDSEDEEISNFVEDLLGDASIKKLNTVELNKKVFTIAGKQMASSVKSYAINKEKLYIGEYSEINGLKNRDYYNGLLAEIFTKFSKKVEINKFQNEFAKNLSTLTFSFNSYQDENLDFATREFFRKKFVNDLKKLQVSYSKIQKKENTIKNFFFKKL